MKFAIGKKDKMTQMFDDNGIAQPVTIVSFGPMKITQIKTDEKDGYSAVQVGYGSRSKKNLSKAQIGQMGVKEKEKGFEGLKEFRALFSDEVSERKKEDEVKPEFEVGDVVTISSVSKGKGFQGVIKRHGFHGSDATHGQKHSLRKPGSIGAGGVQRVMKGRKMPGRMGGQRVSEKGKKILLVDHDKKIIFVKGSIPGRRGSLVEIKKR